MNKTMEESKQVVLQGLGNGNNLTKAVEIPPGASEAMKRFFSMLNYLPKAVKEKVLSGEVELDDVIVYDTAVLAGTTAKFFEQDTSIVRGICNLDKGKLPADKNFVPIFIYLEYAATDAGATPPVFTLADLPASVSGELEVKRNGGALTYEIPLQAFKRREAGQNVYRYEISVPKLFLGDKRMEAEINILTAFGSGTHSLRVTYEGVGIKDKLNING